MGEVRRSETARAGRGKRGGAVRLRRPRKGPRRRTGETVFLRPGGAAASLDPMASVPRAADSLEPRPAPMKPVHSLLAVLCCSLLAFAGCATHIRSDVVTNPPPAEPFANFTRIQVGAVRLAREYAGKGSNDRALAKIQENLTARTAPLLARWNGDADTKAPKRTLLVDPVVTELKFIDGNARFWAGPMAGSSAVILRVRITEYETGRLIATPEFYARADSMGGTWTIGATDNVMLVRIAGRLAEYLEANYDRAVGGPSGVDVK